MITLFNTPLSSPVVIIILILFFITSSITVFDKRMIQAKRNKVLPPDEPMLPNWVGWIGWIHWGLGLSIILLNWQIAIVVFIAKFILSVLPVLEIMGNILMRPFKPSK